jgi:hypothetical protein
VVCFEDDKGIAITVTSDHYTENSWVSTAMTSKLCGSSKAGQLLTVRNLAIVLQQCSWHMGILIGLQDIQELGQLRQYSV